MYKKLKPPFSEVFFYVASLELLLACYLLRSHFSFLGSVLKLIEPLHYIPFRHFYSNNPIADAITFAVISESFNLRCFFHLILHSSLNVQYKMR
jgi:hypothetical protein